MGESAGVQLPEDRACLLTGTASHGGHALPLPPSRLRDARPPSISHTMKGCQWGTRRFQGACNSLGGPALEGWSGGGQKGPAPPWAIQDGSKRVILQKSVLLSHEIVAVVQAGAAPW